MRTDISLGVLRAGASDCSPDSPFAKLKSGPIFGAEVQLPGGAPINKFLGIPYGEIPQRFDLPEEPRRWRMPLNTTEFGPSCLQHFSVGALSPPLDLLEGVFGGEAPESEDCLFINAFAPATPGPNEGRPVVLFIPGGGFQQGNGLADLSGFAAYEDIVAFIFNYRTNVLGFPSSPDIPLEERNIGLHDQRLAIEWVQKNAAAFGGDPSKVTIWGESAGSMSVDIHVSAYANVDPPPFRAAMMYSGQMSWGMLAATGSPTDAESWNSLSKAVGCPGKASERQLECMRNANATQILEQMQKLELGFGPRRDNMTLPSQTAKRWRSGNIAKVPILTGTIAQEGRSLVNSEAPLELFMQSYFPDPLVSQKQRDAIVDFYRALPEVKTAFDLTSSIYTDWFWQCPQNLLAKTSASIDNPTWRFYFNESVISLFPEGYEWLQKAHGSDVLLLFSTPTFEGDANGVELTPELYTFANNFRALTGKFVRNPTGGPGWPAVSSQYAPVDVANLGDLGDVHTAGITPVNQTELDSRCVLYEELYPLVEKYILQ